MTVKVKTAAEAGWRVSRYNITAPLPGSVNTAIANLFSGFCDICSPYELFLMNALDTVGETHPLLGTLAQRGVIVNFDERAVLETMGRYACADSHTVSLLICPTLSCNFDCPYCFENHRSGKMTEQIQSDVLGLTERMLKASRPENLYIIWFGGEPLLAPDVIEALSEKLIMLAAESGAVYEAGVVTNGYLLSPKIVNMLDRVQVKHVQVTLDGVGAVHDATRHLLGGGATFDRITANLRDQHIPFPVLVRHNVHEGNRDQIGAIKAYIKDIARESGNRLIYAPAIAFPSKPSNERGAQVQFCGSDLNFRLQMNMGMLTWGYGHYCSTSKLFTVKVDERGNLYKCPKFLSDPDQSFGTAAEWDPADPIKTAAFPDRLTCWLNIAAPFSDPECKDCIWLPQCRGGCPAARLEGRRQCIPWKKEPELFVRSLVDGSGGTT